MYKSWLPVLIFDSARKEILSWPLEARKDLGSVLTKLQKKIEIGFPDTRPVSTIELGVFEVRIKEASGVFRAFYVIKSEYGILVFHAFQKKSQKTPKHEIELGRQRLRLFMDELKNEK